MMKILIYGCFGMVLEVIWTGTWSLVEGDAALTATTYLWMMPIYGCSAIALEYLHDKIRTRSMWIRGSVWMLFIFTLEFIYGYLLRSQIGICPWEYKNGFFTIDGLIRLDYAPLWFVMGLLFEALHDRLEASSVDREE